MKVMFQIGYRKTMGYRKYGQVINAFINDVECSFRDRCGRYLTSKSKAKKGVCWFMWADDVEHGDVIRLSVKTATQDGVDEDRTFEVLYCVDRDAPLREIKLRGVGCKKTFLLKGYLVEMGKVSETDKRMEALEVMANDDDFWRID